jgi:hypothetical protein
MTTKDEGQTILRLVGVEWLGGATRLDRTEGTATSALFAHDHDRRCGCSFGTSPTLTNIWTAGLFTNRRQFQRSHCEDQ